MVENIYTDTFLVALAFKKESYEHPKYRQIFGNFASVELVQWLLL
jgi:hypothetical protein